MQSSICVKVLLRLCSKIVSFLKLYKTDTCTCTYLDQILEKPFSWPIICRIYIELRRAIMSIVNRSRSVRILFNVN